MELTAVILAVTSGAAAAFLAGYVAKLLLPGQQRVSNIVLIAIGSIAGLIASVIANIFNLDEGDGIGWWSIGISVALSMVAILLLTNWKSEKIEALKTPKPIGAGGPGGPGAKNTGPGVASSATGPVAKPMANPASK